ncbi:MAG: glycosyltransferase family 4 protein [Candidatus Bathyarchaeia archaeon]
MILCFTSHRYAPLVGGYDNQIRLLAENLSRFFPVKVVTFNLTGSVAAESIGNVQVYRVKPQLVFFRVPFSAAFLRKLGSLEFDILHAHGFVPVVSDLCVAYAKSKGKATVYTHHFDGNVQDAQAWNLLADAYNRTVARFSFKYADALVATTKSYAETSPALKRDLGRVKVIPCFVDCRRFKPQPREQVDALRRQLGLGGAKTVLFVGRIVPYKGLEYLVRAVEEAKQLLGEDLRLLVVGGEEGKNITGKSSYYAQIRRQAEQSGVGGSIRFLGRVPDSQLATLYSLADALALPSVMRGEAFGTVLLEALACGTPVVASDIAGVKDVLMGDGSVGSYVPARDAAALAKALVRMAHRKDEVSERCVQFAFDNYRVEKIVQEYVNLYTSLKR